MLCMLFEVGKRAKELSFAKSTMEVYILAINFHEKSHVSQDIIFSY